MTYLFTWVICGESPKVNQRRWTKVGHRQLVHPSTPLITSVERNCLHGSLSFERKLAITNLFTRQPHWSLPLKGTVYTVHFSLNESWPSPTCSPVNPVDHFRWKELFTRFTLVDSTALINLGDPCKRALRVQLHCSSELWHRQICLLQTGKWNLFSTRQLDFERWQLLLVECECFSPVERQPIFNLNTFPLWSVGWARASSLSRLHDYTQSYNNR